MKQISTMEDTIRQAYQAPEIEVIHISIQAGLLANSIEGADIDDDFDM